MKCIKIMCTKTDCWVNGRSSSVQSFSDRQQTQTGTSKIQPQRKTLSVKTNWESASMLYAAAKRRGGTTCPWKPSYRGSMHATNELFRIYVAWCGTRRGSPQDWCDVFSSCYTRRGPATTWRTTARSASSATRTNCSSIICRIPRQVSGHLVDAGTTSAPLDGLSTWY